MPPKVAKAYQPPTKISKSRVLNSAILTFLGLAIIIGLFYHLVWALGVLRTNAYGDILSNIMFGFGTLFANGVVSFRLLTYLNVKLIDDKIDADHKKYI